MKITDDIVKALQNCIDGIGSISEFSQRANVNIETVSQYMTRKTKSIHDDTWKKLYPLIQPYLSKGDSDPAVADMKKMKECGYADLCCDQKILLDAFCALPKEIQEEQLLHIVELARKQIHDNKNKD
jgi:hypothetical protein